MATVEAANRVFDYIANISFNIFSILGTFLLIYFILQQIRIYKQCKSVKLTSDIKNISRLKNLKIKYHINNFMILILSIETLQCILAFTFVLSYAHYNNTQITHYNLTSSCTITSPAIASLRSLSGWWIHVPIRISKVFHLILYPMINLLLAMVYLSYLASNYLPAVYKGLGWIALRFVVVFILSSIFETSIVGFWIGSKFLLFYDIHKYIVYSLRFSRVLRGMRDEARIHANKKTYIFKSSIHEQFVFSSLVLLTILASKALSIIFTDYGLALDILFEEPCYFSYLTGNAVQISISPTALAGYKIASNYLQLIAGFFFVIYQGMSILIYTLLLLKIVLGACACTSYCTEALVMVFRRKKGLNQEELIRPLIDKYHARIGLK